MSSSNKYGGMSSKSHISIQQQSESKNRENKEITNSKQEKQVYVKYQFRQDTQK